MPRGGDRGGCDEEAPSSRSSSPHAFLDEDLGEEEPEEEDAMEEFIGIWTATALTVHEAQLFANEILQADTDGDGISLTASTKKP